MTKGILVSEIFGPTIQGEGPLIGRPTLFVRTAGCDYRCRWCDTLYAVLPEHRPDWIRLTADEIVARLDALASGVPILVSLSGGNPALQPLEPLIKLGQRKGYTFALETQGSLPCSWYSSLDSLVLSPKPPSSGMSTDWDALKACVEAAQGVPRCLKIVVFDDADYAFARTAAVRHPDLPIYLQVGNPSPAPSQEPDLTDLTRRYRWLTGKAMEDSWFGLTILPQLHVLVWGNRGGV